MKIDNSTAFTLMELIIASLIVGIVMLGIVTSNIALQGNVKGFAGSYYVVQKTTNSLNHIITAASLAVGTPSDPGIIGDQAIHSLLVYDDSGTIILNPWTIANNTFCIHQNVSPGDTGWPGTVDITGTLNRWLCYTAPQGTDTTSQGGAANDYNIYWCSKPYNFGAPPTYGASTCPIDSSHIIGSAKTITTSFLINSHCANIPCDGAQTAYFQVNIENCLNNTTCNSGDPGNPYVQKSGRVSPSGHSAG